jgi:hypothetical protein
MRITTPMYDVPLWTRIDGAIAVVTGGARGFGRAVVLSFNNVRFDGDRSAVQKMSCYARLIRTALTEAQCFPATFLVLVAFDGLRDRTPPRFVRDADPIR